MFAVPVIAFAAPTVNVPVTVSSPLTFKPVLTFNKEPVEPSVIALNVDECPEPSATSIVLKPASTELFVKAWFKPSTASINDIFPDPDPIVPLIAPPAVSVVGSVPIILLFA